ncbi:rhodanese domain-containing protein CG4456-like [Bacillus rossius redtenbacheri]|uniref:rhodanese domain-containing protein CG4456-like n=1 Tax=Bacillus rossius redtenbacheri TaxID=93214 RepID=UPI002FDE689A
MWRNCNKLILLSVRWNLYDLKKVPECLLLKTQRTASPRAPPAQPYSSMATPACPERAVRVVTYEQVRGFIEDKSALIVDVRNPEELREGAIPTSVNVPLGELEHALRDLTDEQFRARYGRAKPRPTDKLVFSCRLGGRAAQATQTAAALGYCNVFNYKGSWTEWAERSRK